MSRETPTGTDEIRMRQEYGYVRGYFRNRPEKYREYQVLLDQARMGKTYDVYLSDSVRYSVLAGVVGFILGLFLLVGAYFSGFPSLFPVTAETSVFVWAATVLTLTAIPSVTVWLSRYLYPYLIKTGRGYRIDKSLPSAVVFMHALSTGGMSTLEVMEKLSESKDAYGEAAVEFEMIMGDIEYFSDDLLTALQNAKEKTPSEKFRVFVDDMISVIESGGDLRNFLESESEKQIREVRDENSEFLETLEVLAEAYIILVFAAPIFLIVILVALSFAGSATLTLTRAVAYAIIPVSIVFSILAVDILNRQFEEESKDLKLPKEDGSEEREDSVEDDEDTRFEEYDRHLRKRRFWEKVTSPLSPVMERPVLSLLVTVPVAFLFAGLVVLSGTVTLSVDAYMRDPVVTTTWIVVAPFLIPSTVYMVFHEKKRRRKNDIKKRFPEMLEAVAGANRNGITLADCFDMVSRRSEGTLANHMKRLNNDIRWNTDMEKSLVVSANDIGVPRISKAMKLIAEGSKSTGNLSGVLEIVAEDMDNHSRIEMSRKQTMATYVVVIFVGVLVYLFIAVLFDSFFFAQIESVGETSADVDSGFMSGEIPTDAFRIVLYHSALLQALGNGLAMGKLIDNRIASGLIYANILLVLVTVVFIFS